MDITELQSRLPQLSHLLPSQREWLERLLFQLAFNDSDQIYIFGPVGAGKSTLAMAIAELFSEHFNIALLSSNIDESQVPQQLMQQWFGKTAQADIAITEQITADLSQLPLLLIVDDAERYSTALTQQLNALASLQFYFSTQSPDSPGLTLTLNRITTADAEFLLHHAELNSIELAERLALAGGNIRLLLQPSERPGLIKTAPDDTAPKPNKQRYATVALIVSALLAYALWPEPHKPRQATRQPIKQQIAPETQQDGVAPTGIAPADITPIAIGQSEHTDPLLADADAKSSIVDAVSQRDDDTLVPEPEITAQNTAVADIKADITIESPAVASGQDEPDISSSADTTWSVLYQHDETQLLSLQKHQVAVQLAVLSSEAALKRFKRNYPQLTTLSYQRNWQGKMQLVLLLAPFDDAPSAKAELKQLPEALRATGPFIKAVQAVQAEIRARSLSQQNSKPE
jgi:DamX protein